MVVKKLSRLILPPTRQYSNSAPAKDVNISYTLKELFEKQNEMIKGQNETIKEQHKLIDKLRMSLAVSNVVVSIIGGGISILVAFALREYM